MTCAAVFTPWTVKNTRQRVETHAPACEKTRSSVCFGTSDSGVASANSGYCHTGWIAELVGPSWSESCRSLDVSNRSLDVGIDSMAPAQPSCTTDQARPRTPSPDPYQGRCSMSCIHQMPACATALLSLLHLIFQAQRSKARPLKRGCCVLPWSLLVFREQELKGPKPAVLSVLLPQCHHRSFLSLHHVGAKLQIGRTIYEPQAGT